MLTPSQIREIARRQRQRGVEVVCVKSDDHRIKIRIAAAAAAAASGPIGSEASNISAPPSRTVRSQCLGIAVLSGRPELPRPIQKGDTVDEGQVLAFVELGADRQAVRSPSRATVDAVLVQSGQRVDYGMALFELTPAWKAAT